MESLWFRIREVSRPMYRLVVALFAHADRKFKQAKDPPASTAQMRGLLAKRFVRTVAGEYLRNSACEDLCRAGGNPGPTVTAASLLQ